MLQSSLKKYMHWHNDNLQGTSLGGIPPRKNLTWLVDKNKLTKNIQKTKRMVAYKLKLVQPETISLSEIAPKIYSWVPLK